MGEKALFLEIMQQIASARNVESYRKSVESLQKSKLYTGNPNIAEYGEKCGWTVPSIARFSHDKILPHLRNQLSIHFLFL